VREFEVDHNVQWTVDEYATGFISSIDFGNCATARTGADEVCSGLPICCIPVNDESWVVYDYLPSDVALITFKTADGTLRSQTPNRGVAIVPNNEVNMFDQVGRRVDVLPTERRASIQEGEGALYRDAQWTAATFGSSLNSCLKAANFDVHAADIESDATWHRCILRAAVDWENDALKRIAGSATPVTP
jgi:hypothetical protein